MRRWVGRELFCNWFLVSVTHWRARLPDDELIETMLTVCLPINPMCSHESRSRDLICKCWTLCRSSEVSDAASQSAQVITWQSRAVVQTAVYGINQLLRTQVCTCVGDAFVHVLFYSCIQKCLPASLCASLYAVNTGLVLLRLADVHSPRRP